MRYFIRLSLFNIGMPEGDLLGLVYYSQPPTMHTIGQSIHPSINQPTKISGSKSFKTSLFLSHHCRDTLKMVCSSSYLMANNGQIPVAQVMHAEDRWCDT